MGSSTALSPTPLPDILKLLADDLRWQLVQALAFSDRKVQELVTLVGRPMNLVSYHLRRLREGNLVHEHRSIADGRDVYYSLDLNTLKVLYYESGTAIHPALGSATEQPPMTTSETLPPTRILYLCTHNSARSQMAEALTQFLGKARVIVESAGTEPSVVNPYAVQTMKERGIDISTNHSKHLNEFLEQEWDYIITTCDSAREACPVFPGDPAQIHWSFPDPSAVEGSDADKLKAFRKTAQELTFRINHLLILIDRQRQGRLQ
jgi:thioredoxin type arsenate reductase